MTGSRIRGRTMRMSLRAMAASASALVLLTIGVTWQLAFRAPAEEPAPVPARLLSLATAQGMQLLAGAAGVDHHPLVEAFESQRRPAYCGVASSVVVLNAMRPSHPRLTQTAFFTEWTTELRVTLAGMSLQELGEHLRSHGAQVQVVHAADTTRDAFRQTVARNLRQAGDYVLVNYQRAALGQREGGHISPVAAYSAASDRFLILDVAAHRYPPVWVSTDDLWLAMNSTDSSAGRSRGYVLVMAARPPP